MATDGSPQIDVASLTKKADQVEREAAAIAEAVGRGKRVRLCILIAGLVVVGGVIWKFAGLITQYNDPETVEEISALATKQLDMNYAGYEDQIRMLVDNAAPKLKDAMQAQVNKDMDEWKTTLTAERKLLIENLQGRMAKKIDERHQKLMADYQSLLEQEFPAAKDRKMRDQMVSNFEKALKGLVQKYYIEEMRKSLEDMYATWDEFPIADPIDKGELALEDELYGVLLELLTVKLSAQHDLSDPDDVKVEGRTGTSKTPE